ncbi:MAG: hypothetical protein HGB12_08030 [Bacteroidetes bacterium]|nr:hypothetical protein [Bacteroidota bacterium]
MMLSYITQSQASYKYIIPAISGLIGVVLGFLLNRINDFYVKGYDDLTNFKKCLLLFSNGESRYMELYLLYSVLRKKDKNKINIDEVNKLKPDEKQNYCYNLINKL